MAVVRDLELPVPRLVVPSSAFLTPMPATGLPSVISGGQIEAHEPVQLLWFLVSGVER